MPQRGLDRFLHQVLRGLGIAQLQLLIVANAQVYPRYGWSEAGREPGMADTLEASFDAALGILKTETVLLAKNGFQMWAQGINAKRAASEPKVKVDFAVITFNQISDPAERQRFDAMPTTFRLGPEQVDALRGMAGRLLEQSPEFRSFVRAERHDGP